MNLMPVLWKRCRRALFRAVAVICALAAVSYGAVAVTAAPARAQPITSGGPFTLTWPGGDLVASYDIANADPASMSNVISTTWPELVGLSPNPSPSALIQATWQQYDSTAPAGDDPQPPAFSGGLISASSDGNGGSIVTIDIPAADFQANALNSFLAGVLSAAAGVLTTLAVFVACEVLFLRVGGSTLRGLGPEGTLGLTTLGTGICTGFGAALGTLVTNVVNQWLTGGPFDSDFWSNTAAQALTNGLGAAASVWLVGIWVFGLSYLLAGVSNTITKLISFIKPFVSASTWNSIEAGVQRFFSKGWQQMEVELGNIARRAGYPAPRSSGQVHTPPASTAPATPGTPVAAQCMDAYGSSGDDAIPGQIVATNSCDGAAAQDWVYYPNGNILVSGMCLDTQGGTSSLGTPLIDLEPCDGAAAQEWEQVGTSLENQATSDCLDDPNGDTTPGTQLDLSPCNGSQAQQWVTPSPDTCDIYASYGTACVAAYSMTRALYAAYDGPLYQVQRASDAATTNIGLLNTGGDVDAAAQDSFCAGTTCTITEIYDQSALGNNLTIEGPGGNAPQGDQAAVANALPIKVGGNEAYGLDIEPGVGYRDNTTIGVATSGSPEGMYMVASGTHVNSQCCFDFGNAEANSDDNGAGRMDAVNLSTTCYNSQPSQCTGSGPWVQADMENGLFMGSEYANTANQGNNTPFVTAMLGNDGQKAFTLNGGDATSGGLSTWYNGSLPAGYAPMQQEGAVVLGTGGDGSNSDVGSWFEGVMTAGDPSQAADAAVQANIVAAGYSGDTNPVPGSGSGPSNGVTPSAAGQAVVHAAGATGAAASGYSSVYTVDAANGDLQETYLPVMGGPWHTQDLAAQFHTPPVMPGTQPVALVHCGYTSVYTIDAADGDLQETYLPAIGDGWATQDLSAKYNTPPTDATPTAVVHYAGAAGATAGCGYTSVYTVDRNGDLQETYLPNAGFPGDSWHTQDLSANYNTPQVLAGTSPVAIVHCGYTSVYTVNGDNHHLQETYLAAIGGPWATQDLSANYNTPQTDTTPTAVVHSAGAAGATTGCGYTSVYTVDEGSRHLQETYLPNAGFPGDSWHTQDLSASYEKTPAVAPGTAPVALVHMNYTSVYTVDEGSDQVQETYLPAIGDGWSTQSLSAKYNTPTTDQTPIVLLHPDAGGNLDWTSVYTINELNNDLQETYLSNAGFPGDPWATQDLTANYNTPPEQVLQSSQAGWSLAHAGYTSVFTIDSGASQGDLQETYLSNVGNAWATHNLSTIGNTPQVQGDSRPVALVHDGYTSVFTVDAGNGTGVNTGNPGDNTNHLQETYLSGIGAPWATHDLSAMAGTPPVEVGSSPAAVFHDGYTSVYTVDAGHSLDLQETYLSGIGAPWITHDLSTMAGTPAVKLGTSPVAVFHDGYTSVYTIDSGSGDLQETYLPVMGGSWVTLDLSKESGTPATSNSPTVVFHDGFTSVYTIDYSGDLQETYLPAIGDQWVTQDLTSVYHGPSGEDFAPVALYHTGYTSVYYLASGGGLEEAYLPAIGGPWQFQNLSQVPATLQPPSPLVHYASNGALTWTSLFTIDSASAVVGHLQETYLPAIGDLWTTHDLTAMTSGPPACAGVSCG